MLSLAMIVKPTAEEANLLDRCLKYLKGNVDEICITQAGEHPSKDVSRVIEKYGGKEFFYQWNDDFASARNYSFSVTTGDFIFWCDADDIVRGAEKLKPLAEKMSSEAIDAVVMNYLYEFDKEGKCTVKHLKTRVVKRDAVSWVGEIHEDFQQQRQLNSLFTDEIEIMHLTNEGRAKRASKRNIAIAKQYMEKYPNDPRSEWLVANALIGEGKPERAVGYLKKFVKRSGAEEEIFIAYLRLGDITEDQKFYLEALSLRPTYPDAYHRMGELLKKQNKYHRAIEFFIEGLKKNVPDRTIIVYNPRDYDFNPMMLLADCYFQTREFKKAFEVLKRCQKIYPENDTIKKYQKMIEREQQIEAAVSEFIEKTETVTSKDELKKMIDGFEFKSHPRICILKNLNFVKTETSGKDLVYYCSYTDKVWNPEVAEQDGVGGSEEAVIHLSKRFAKMGWNVTVYNNCGTEKVYDGVTYKPYWDFNIRDKQDVIILWRHPKPLDFNLNADKILLDLHDVLPEGELTPDRVEKLHKIMVKTMAHRKLFPKVSDDKFAIIPNGIDVEQFNEEVERNPYLILTTSSPDRHLDATLDVFEKLISSQPEKPWKLAWYYGWGNFLAWHKDNPDLMEYYSKQNKRFMDLIEKKRAEGGTMISHGEIAKKYKEAGIFFYPTQFYEIHCISAAKAQAAGCKMLTSDFAALDETVQFGKKIHTSGKKWTKENTFGDTENIDAYVDNLKDILNQENDIMEVEWAKKTFNWDKITNDWDICIKS